MKVLVGMSGGIDSSVAAYLLKREGHEVEGVTMLIWKKDSPYPAPVSPNSCYSPAEEQDKEETAAICRKIGIPYHVLDCSDIYEATVLENFRSEYMNGRTPNPCVWCNAKIKFGALVDHAREKGLVFDKFATGHYARITFNEALGRYELRKGKDLKKDQSYFLYRLSQAQLSRTLFPLGEYEKTEIRQIDEREGYHEPGQSESQDFYGGDYTDLLSVEDKKGRIVDTEGRTLGYHNGFWHYTVGQRKGLGIAHPFPLYVLRLDPEKNEVVVGGESDTFSHEIFVSDVNYVSRTEFEEGKVYSVKIRSTSPGEAALAEKTDDGFVLRFLSPVKAATSGQSAVVYDEDMVVAGGLIC